jgi:sugar/nucleoside kinase (ribokinase family)
MSANKVLCYGGIAVESFIELPYQPKPGIAHIICDEYYRIGGGAANAAEWLASWGIPTRLSGYVIGYDRYGDQLREWLSEYPSLDLSYLQRQKEINTLISRTIPFPDGNKYLLCSGYAEVTLTPPTPKLLEDIQILEIAFYFRQARGNAASAEIARLAAGRGIKIVAMDLLTPDAETVPAAEVIVNSAASILEQFPSADVGEHSNELQAASKGIVITTDGSQQIHAIDRDGTQYSLLPPKVTPVETTGAGDSFRAGIIYGLLQQWSLSHSLRWAAAVSALQIQRSLAQDRPPTMEKIASLAERIEVRRMD